jgi:DNA mismatch repair protein MutS
VLQRLRDDEAIDVRGSKDEATGESKQVVFDLGAGQFRGQASADGGEGETVDPVTESVLEELRGVDVEDTTPVELLSRVQEWQRRLDD